MRGMKMSLLSIGAAAIVAFHPPLVSATESESFSELCSSERCSEMLRRFERYSDNGHAGSMVLMALAYAQGDGVEVDYDKARMWLKEAIRMRSAIAPYVAAQWHRQGLVFEQSDEKAEDYMDRAIDYGYPLAKFERAVRLMQDGVEIPKALTLLEEAADAGLPNAQYLLARLVEEGQYYQQNSVAAGLMYRDLAVSGYRDTRQRLNEIVASVQQEESYITGVGLESKESIISLLTAYDDMEVITISGQYESFEDHIASIQEDLDKDFYRSPTGTRLRRMPLCGNMNGYGCNVIFDRRAGHESAYFTLGGILRRPGGY